LPFELLLIAQCFN